MREIRLPKGGGQYRTVYAPSQHERRRLRKLLPLLEAAERRATAAAGTQDCAHGFVCGRNPVTCALAHVGYPVTVCCDLAGWFDSVRPEQIAAGLAAGGADPALAEKVCYLGAPRQGLPTSPAAANLAAVELDRRILAALPPGAAYTRYADDLSVSLAVDAPEGVAAVLAALASAAEALGWALAGHKTRVQRARAGRRIIVGVSVGETDIRAPREMRRKLRAARHHGAGRTAQARGLAEWCAMRLPRAARPARQILGAATGVAPSVPATTAAVVAQPAAVAVSSGRRIIMGE